MNTNNAWLATFVVALGCGGSGTFGLVSEDNNPERLAEALALRSGSQAKPINETGTPLAFLVLRPHKGKGHALVAFDLVKQEEKWRIEDEPTSRIVVGTSFVAYRNRAESLVARRIGDGGQLWTKRARGEFLGISADASSVYYVVADKSGGSKAWQLTAIDGATGNTRWSAPAKGRLGAPAARDGLVYSPFLKQWLAIIDAKTGKQIARIRGIDEEISFVRTAGADVMFGSKFGVFLLDKRAASGKRQEATYGKAQLPDEFVNARYHRDAFDVVQAGYSAHDRNRMLWRAGADDAGGLRFAGNTVVVHSYRFFFGFDAQAGSLKWAYSHPRTDAVASEHNGAAIVLVSAHGEIVALDPNTGTRLYSTQIDGRVAGATFDTEGWAPKANGQAKADTVGALVAIARDRDARFDTIKRFAIQAVAKLPGADVSKDLLGLLSNKDASDKLKQTAAKVLVERKDPAAVPHLVAALSLKSDFIADTKPQHIDVVSRALANLKGAALSAQQRESAVAALLQVLNAPETGPGDLRAVIQALVAIGAGRELAALRSLLLTYRADPDFAADLGPVTALIDGLLERGMARDRELLQYVINDPRTHKSIRDYAVTALSQTRE